MIRTINKIFILVLLLSPLKVFATWNLEGERYSRVTNSYDQKTALENIAEAVVSTLNKTKDKTWEYLTSDEFRDRSIWVMWKILNLLNWMKDKAWEYVTSEEFKAHVAWVIRNIGIGVSTLYEFMTSYERPEKIVAQPATNSRQIYQYNSALAEIFKDSHLSDDEVSSEDKSKTSESELSSSGSESFTNECREYIDGNRWALSDDDSFSDESTECPSEVGFLKSHYPIKMPSSDEESYHYSDSDDTSTDDGYGGLNYHHNLSDIKNFIHTFTFDESDSDGGGGYKKKKSYYEIKNKRKELISEIEAHFKELYNEGTENVEDELKKFNFKLKKILRKKFGFDIKCGYINLKTVNLAHRLVIEEINRLDRNICRAEDTAKDQIINYQEEVMQLKNKLDRLRHKLKKVKSYDEDLNALSRSSQKLDLQIKLQRLKNKLEDAEMGLPFI